MELEFLIKEPSFSVKAPLLILLHGYGSNEQDLFSFASELPDNYRIISLRAPYNLGMHNSFAWYAINFDADQNKFSDTDQAKSSMELLNKTVVELQEKYGNHAEDTALIGFSQGCILSMAFALNYPKLVNNIVGLSGYLIPDLLPNQDRDYSNLHIYNSHGTMDGVIPLSWAEKTENYMQKHHIDYVFETYTVGHGVHPQNFYSFKAWLETHLATNH